MEHLSSTSQRSSSDFIMFYLRELTPLVSRRYSGIAPPLMNSCWCDTSHQFFPIHKFWVVVNRQHWIPFVHHPFPRCCRYSMASSETSRHKVSCSSPTFGHFPSVNWTHREKFHSCPSMICVIVDNFPWLHANTSLVMYVLICLYTWYLCIITFSPPFVYLIFLVI